MNIVYHLKQNYSNLFITITIEYSLPDRDYLSIVVYHVLGNKVGHLVNEEKIAGNYKDQFNGSNLTSRIYFYRIISNDYSVSNKMLLLK